MSEREPRRQPSDQQPGELARQQAEGDQPAWDLPAIAQALNAPPEPERVDDVAFGAGHRVRFGDDQRTHLEIFPAAGVVRLTAADAQLSLFRQQAPKISETEVVFDGPTVFLSLVDTGEVTLQLAPAPPEPSQETPPAPLQSPARPLSGSEPIPEPLEQHKPVLASAGRAEPAPPPPPAAADTVARPGPSTPPTESSAGYVAPAAPQRPPAPPEAAKQPRVTLSGRLVHAPWFRETPKQKLPIGGFKLAVTDQDNIVTYHDVVAFGERATKLRELQLEQGQVVEVIGFQHLVPKRTREGMTMTEEIRAAVIRQPGTKGQPKPS